MSQADKTTRPVEPAEPSNKWNSGNLFWGGLFLLAGLLLLLDNLNIVEVEWGSIWKLWPIVVIVIGLSILKLRGWVAGLVYTIATVVIVAIVWSAMTGSVGGDDRQSTTRSEAIGVSRSSDEVKNLKLNIESGAASLDISSTDSSDLVVGKSSGDNTTIDRKSTIDGDTQIVTLTQNRQWSWRSPVSRSKLDVQLSQSVPTDLKIDAGASSIDADLSSVILKSLLVDSGASSIDLRLGDKFDQTDVRIDTGVSSVTIYVPKSSGVKLVIDGGLNSKDMPSDYQEVDEDIYQSEGYDQADKKITIDLDMGVSSFKLLTY